MTSDKPTWPKTEHGTVDWEAVFEHPETGLIGLISQARTPKTLKASTSAVINMIHNRDDDGPVVAQLIAELSDTIPEDMKEEHFPAVRTAVVAFLRRLKQERIHRAETYVQELKFKRLQAKMQQDRRKRAEEEKRQRHLGHVFAERWYLVASAVVVVLAGIGTWIWLAPEEEDPLYLKFVAQLENAATHIPARVHVYNGFLEAGMVNGRMTVTATNVPRTDCVDIAVALNWNGVVAIDGKIPDRSTVEQFAELCRSDPGLMTLTWVPYPQYLTRQKDPAAVGDSSGGDSEGKGKLLDW